MEIPRGTFREIRKGEVAGVLVAALVRERFTGSCTIAGRDASGCLVFDAGRCILAEYGTGAGDAAFDAVCRLSSPGIDAALSVLTHAQIHLCMEFNQTARVRGNGSLEDPKSRPAVLPTKRPETGPASGKPAVNHVLPDQSLVLPKPGRTASPGAGLGHKAIAPHPASSHKKPVIRVIPVVAGERGMHARDDDSDLAALDSLNVEKMTDQIRTECRTIVRHLDLDYLMDRH